MIKSSELKFCYFFPLSTDFLNKILKIMFKGIFKHLKIGLYSLRFLSIPYELSVLPKLIQNIDCFRNVLLYFGTQNR